MRVISIQSERSASLMFVPTIFIYTAPRSGASECGPSFLVRTKSSCRGEVRPESRPSSGWESTSADRGSFAYGYHPWSWIIVQTESKTLLPCRGFAISVTESLASPLRICPLNSHDDEQREHSFAHRSGALPSFSFVSFL